MALDKNVIVFQEPKGDGRYALLVSRPGSMMGGGQVAFFVDGVTIQKNEKGEPYEVIGQQEGKTAVRFPWGIPYMLIRRELITFIDSVQAATSNKEEETAVKAIWNRDNDESSLGGSKSELPIGQYV